MRAPRAAAAGRSRSAGDVRGPNTARRPDARQLRERRLPAGRLVGGRAARAADPDGRRRSGGDLPGARTREAAPLRAGWRSDRLVPLGPGGVSRGRALRAGELAGSPARAAVCATGGGVVVPGRHRLEIGAGVGRDGAGTVAHAPLAGGAGRGTNRVLVDPVIAKGTCFPLFAYEVAYAIDLDEAERRVVAGTERQTVKFKRRAPPHFEYPPAPPPVGPGAESLAIPRHPAAPGVGGGLDDFRG